MLKFFQGQDVMDSRDWRDRMMVVALRSLESLKSIESPRFRKAFDLAAVSPREARYIIRRFRW